MLEESNQPAGRKLPVRFGKPTVFDIQIFRSKASRESMFWNTGHNLETASQWKAIIRKTAPHGWRWIAEGT
jgi:hypothetical protein